MAPFADEDPPVPVQDRTAAPHGHGECSAGKDEVQFRQRAVVCADLFDILRSLFAQPGKDHLDLLLFLCKEFFQVVVQLYDSHRFNEQCGTGGGLVVDQSLNLRTVF